jgi:hypothetical protein
MSSVFSSVLGSFSSCWQLTQNAAYAIPTIARPFISLFSQGTCFFTSLPGKIKAYAVSFFSQSSHAAASPAALNGRASVINNDPSSSNSLAVPSLPALKTISANLTPNPNLIGEPDKWDIGDQLDDFKVKMKHLLDQKELSYENCSLYNSLYTNLMKPYLKDSEEKKLAVLSKLIKLLLFKEHDLPKNIISYVVYRLLNEHNVDKFQSLLAQREWIVFNSLGDGNCMLWSCLFSKEIQDSVDPIATKEKYKNFAQLGPKHPLYQKKYDEMKNLREQMATIFSSLIHGSNESAFRAEFNSYALNNSEVEKAVLGVVSKEEKEKILAAQAPTQKMVENYCTFIKTPGKWNGEFEAELVAILFRRPIVIMSGNSDRNLSFRALAGANFLSESYSAPLVIRHNQVHYDCLLREDCLLQP